MHGWRHLALSDFGSVSRAGQDARSCLKHWRHPIGTDISLLHCAGRKHQLRKACGRVLQAPVVGDGRYGQQRSAEQLWFNAQLDLLPREEADRPEEALGRMLQCNRHLQLHCFQVWLLRWPRHLCRLVLQISCLAGMRHAASQE